MTPEILNAAHEILEAECRALETEIEGRLAAVKKMGEALAALHVARGTLLLVHASLSAAAEKETVQ